MQLFDARTMLCYDQHSECGMTSMMLLPRNLYSNRYFTGLVECYLLVCKNHEYRLFYAKEQKPFCWPCTNHTYGNETTALKMMAPAM